MSTRPSAARNTRDSLLIVCPMATSWAMLDPTAGSRSGQDTITRFSSLGPPRTSSTVSRRSRRVDVSGSQPGITTLVIERPGISSSVRIASSAPHSEDASNVARAGL